MEFSACLALAEAAVARVDEFDQFGVLPVLGLLEFLGSQVGDGIDDFPLAAGEALRLIRNRRKAA